MICPMYESVHPSFDHSINQFITLHREQTSVWELEQNERMLLAKLEDKRDALLSAEKARRAAEERARVAIAETEQLTHRVRLILTFFLFFPGFSNTLVFLPSFQYTSRTFFLFRVFKEGWCISIPVPRLKNVRVGGIS